MRDERLAITWRGLNERGHGRTARGSYTLAEIAGITERYYRRGWRFLEVMAGDGPLGDSNQVEVARIGPHPDTGKRTWWAEGGKGSKPMPEPREPVNDFERWLAGSRVPPDERTPDELCDGIAKALASREFKALSALLTWLAHADPRKAQAVHDMILAACEGDERRATLLAVPGA